MTPASHAHVFEHLDWPATRWFRSNILIDASGQPTGPDGTSRTLTRGRDRALLRQLRQDADAIVTGGATVRAEGWHFPPSGSLVVVSNGDLPLDTCPHPERLRVVTPGLTNESVASALHKSITALRATRILCESGPRLLRVLSEARLIDEAFVSVVPTSQVPSRSESTNRTVDVTENFLVARARAHLNLDPLRFDLVESVNDSDIIFLRFGRRSP